MYEKIVFLRHFKTKIDKDKPVSEWGLDEDGKKAMEELLNQYDFNKIDSIISSPEPKAKITANAISDKFSKSVEIEDLIAEVDRSKAGFVEGDYKEVVKRYFNSDNFEYHWESLEDVRYRIKNAVSNILSKEGTPLVISHGMYLSIMLTPCLDKDIIEFWNELGFGEILEVDREKLSKYWMK